MIALLLSASIGLGLETIDNVDMIELNHFYDQRGCHVYDQVIFWRQDPATKSFEVAAWTMADQTDKYPHRSNGNVWESKWFDGKMYRNVRSRQVRESWTQVDPERVDQKQVIAEERVGLVVQ